MPMKRVASVLILAGLLLAPAAPSMAAKRAMPAATTANALRGPLGPSNAARPLQSIIPARAAIASPLAPPPVTADSCHLTCARAYYFCLASEEADQCSQDWIRCRIPCPPSGGPVGGSLGARP